MNASGWLKKCEAVVRWFRRVQTLDLVPLLTSATSDDIYKAVVKSVRAAGLNPSDVSAIGTDGASNMRPRDGAPETENGKSFVDAQ